MMSDEEFADFRKSLVERGVPLPPEGDVSYQIVEREQAGVVAPLWLDRVDELLKPPYDVFGFAACVVCERMCYLDFEDMHILTKNDDRVPVCSKCTLTDAGFIPIPTMDNEEIVKAALAALALALQEATSTSSGGRALVRQAMEWGLEPHLAEELRQLLAEGRFAELPLNGELSQQLLRAAERQEADLGWLN